MAIEMPWPVYRLQHSLNDHHKNVIKGGWSVVVRFATIKTYNGNSRLYYSHKSRTTCNSPVHSNKACVIIAILDIITWKFINLLASTMLSIHYNTQLFGMVLNDECDEKSWEVSFPMGCCSLKVIKFILQLWSKNK